MPWTNIYRIKIEKQITTVWSKQDRDRRVENERERTKGNQSGSGESDWFTFAYKTTLPPVFSFLTFFPLSKTKFSSPSLSNLSEKTKKRRRWTLIFSGEPWSFWRGGCRPNRAASPRWTAKHTPIKKNLGFLDIHFALLHESRTNFRKHITKNSRSNFSFSKFFETKPYKET